MNITNSQSRTKYPLSRRKILKKTLSSTSGWVGLAVILVVAFTFTATKALSYLLILLPLLLLLVIIGLTYWYQCWYFATYYYELEPDNVVIRKGPITPREVTIPYARIQDVYVDQDLLDRIMGLYDVHLSSATATSGFEAHIDGVERTAADGLRQSILEQVKNHHQSKS